MALTLAYSANNQSTSSQSLGLGSGVAGNLHIGRMAVKALTSDVPATPAGYTDIITQTSSGHVIGKVFGRVLQSGDVAPSVNGGGTPLLTSSEIYTGQLAGTDIAAIVEAATVGLNSSASVINYSASTIATAGCMISGWAIYGTSGTGTIGTPTTFASPVQQVNNFTGSNMKSSLWTDLQTSAANLSAGNFPITSGSANTNRSMILVIKPAASSSVTISDAADERFYHGETGITITGTAFGASQGGGFVKISPTNNIADGSAVTQTVTAWANTSITITTSLSSLSADTNLYLFVANNLGQSNASGYVVQRAKRFRISVTLRDRGDGDDAAVNWASQTGLEYTVRPSLNEAAVLDGAAGTTNASALFQTSYYELVPAGPIADGDDVVLSILKNDAVPANRRAALVVLTPTYE